MRVLCKETIRPFHNGQTPMASLITYITPGGPDMLLRMIWCIGDDTWDENYDLISHDNSATWNEPRLVLKREPAEGGGEYSYGEAAVLYHPGQNKLVTVTNYSFEPLKEHVSLDYPYRLSIAVGDPQDMAAAQVLLTNFDIPEGILMSFCHPLIDTKGRLLFPYMKPLRDTSDRPMHQRGFATMSGQPDVLKNYFECGVLIGEFNASGALDWQVGRTMPFDPDLTSRGMCEPTVIELKDGRFAMVVRGSNDPQPGTDWQPKPGYKWLSFSEDACRTWSAPVPLPCADGQVLESSSTGSWLFRSIADDKMYWIGNLCLHGEPACGNFPRSPLYLAEVQETPFALKRDTIAVIDQGGAFENDVFQLSNFRGYQDRLTGDVVLYMNRFGERGGWEQMGWMNTDLYRYRVALV